VSTSDVAVEVTSDFVTSLRRLISDFELPTSGVGELMQNSDEMKGKWEQVKGRAKQAAGDLTDDDKLRDEGRGDEALGTVREGVGKARRKVGETIEDIGEDLKR
jgi:uncharacterized protein YjbJ (UPF0337 family)